MSLSINEIIRELNEIAYDLECSHYYRESSTISSLSSNIRQARTLPEDIPSRTHRTRQHEFENIYRHIPGFRGVECFDSHIDLMLNKKANINLFPKMFGGISVRVKIVD